MGILSDYKYLLLLAASLSVAFFVFTSDYFDVHKLDIHTRSKIFTILKMRKDKSSQVEKWIDTSESKPYSDYGDGTCPENNQLGLLTDIFREWDSIAKKQNISYFLTCGSLLGAWRNGTLVPKDSDLDILISGDDHWKLDRIKEKRRRFSSRDGSFHLYLQRDWRKPYTKRRRFLCNGKKVPSYSDQCSFQEPLGRLIKAGKHLDIYDYTIKQGWLIDPSEGYHEFPVDNVFPLKYCMFLGMKTKCPRKPKLFLESFYSNLHPNKICRNGKWISAD